MFGSFLPKQAQGQIRDASSSVLQQRPPASYILQYSSHCLGALFIPNSSPGLGEEVPGTVKISLLCLPLSSPNIVNCSYVNRTSVIASCQEKAECSTTAISELPANCECALWFTQTFRSEVPSRSRSLGTDLLLFRSNVELIFCFVWITRV